MQAREQQAKNMAIEILKYGNTVQFSSDSYKKDLISLKSEYDLNFLLLALFIEFYGGQFGGKLAASYQYLGISIAIISYYRIYHD